MTEAAARLRHTPGAPAWASLMVDGLDVGKEFYQGLFGWEFRTGPQQLGPYVRAVAGGHEVAGLGKKADGRQVPVAWLPYLASTDADETAAAVRSYGGTVAVGPLDAETAGRMAIASDPLGAPFGVWRDAHYPGLGTAPLGMLGAPVWFELVTRETSPVVKFYQAVFGYEAKAVEAPGFDYLTLYADGQPVAGIHGVGDALPRDRGPHWRTYFAVEDPDAVALHAGELGGRVVRGPDDSPYGRLATLADPEGAHFSVIRPVAMEG
ncbi:VOC family protein [Streptomyces tubbatahanensis]|uniref:VOC family protein n=1 Tax=Streptomyces tubbatahanensis TaxID=2923272 RepID=A0ABY3XYI4_9ACTN|nr:VOC family protein [Streptomyces tubbatahanensis]UNS99411.1 VOC family protein [Streptomyces tubbatahanensis]